MRTAMITLGTTLLLSLACGGGQPDQGLAYTQWSMEWGGDYYTVDFHPNGSWRNDGLYEGQTWELSGDRIHMTEPGIEMVYDGVLVDDWTITGTVTETDLGVTSPFRMVRMY